MRWWWWSLGKVPKEGTEGFARKEPIRPNPEWADCAITIDDMTRAERVARRRAIIVISQYQHQKISSRT